MPKIFLSYAHVDLGMAKKIYNDLLLATSPKPPPELSSLSTE